MTRLNQNLAALFEKFGGWLLAGVGFLLVTTFGINGYFLHRVFTGIDVMSDRMWQLVQRTTVLETRYEERKNQSCKGE